MLERAPRNGDVEDERRRKLDALKAQPEVQALLALQLEGHYDAWPQDKLPVLGGRTPLEAVNDPGGRERLEALLRDIEGGLRAQLPGLGQRVVDRLRERLGLA